MPLALPFRDFALSDQDIQCNHVVLFNFTHGMTDL